MKKMNGLLTVISTIALAIAPGVTAVARTQAPAPDPSVATFTKVCGNCHTPERVVATRRSRDQWMELVDNMVTRGAKGSDEDLNLVLEYLVSHYGRVNINRATPEEIVEVVPIGAGDSQKIVDYRRAHGRFEDFDALAAVPGIDVAKLRTYQDAISF